MIRSKTFARSRRYFRRVLSTSGSIGSKIRPYARRLPRSARATKVFTASCIFWEGVPSASAMAAITSTSRCDTTLTMARAESGAGFVVAVDRADRDAGRRSDGIHLKRREAAVP